MARVSKSERQEALARLREWIKPGDTVWTDLKHVSRSGMSRTIQALGIRDNEPRYYGWNVAKAIDWPYDDRREGVKVSGCGMDMGFHLVYTLSAYLFPGGFDCLGEHCPSNDHTNRENNAHHRDGGYALRQRWL